MCRETSRDYVRHTHFFKPSPVSHSDVRLGVVAVAAEARVAIRVNCRPLELGE